MNAKPVLQFDLKGNLIKEFDSVNQVKEELGIWHNSVRKAARGECHTAGGFKWKYKRQRIYPKAKISYEFVRELIQEYSETKNLARVSRKRNLVELRMVYYRLCSIYCSHFTLQWCATELGQDHATALYSLNNWNHISKSKSFRYKYLFDVISKELDNVIKDIEDSKTKELRNQIRLLHKAKNRQKQTISDLQKENERLTNLIHESNPVEQEVTYQTVEG